MPLTTVSSSQSFREVIMSQQDIYEYDIDPIEPAPDLSIAHIAWQSDGREVVTHGAPGISAEAVAASKGATDWREVAEGYTPAKTPDELEAAFSATVTARIDEFVKARGWDNLDRVLAQTGEFAADKTVAQTAYDAQWAAAFTLLTDVRSGELSVDAAVAELPALPEWEA
jgi:hypothetical protein